MKDSDKLSTAIQKKSRLVFDILFKSKYACLFWVLSPLVMGFALQIIASNSGNSDGWISGRLEWTIHDVLFLFLYFIPVAIYYKVKDLKALKWSGYYIMVFPFAYLLRLYVASLGQGNFDLESYNIVADIVLDGKSVYGHTHRYNYAPAWAYILAGCKFVAVHFNNSANMFHYLIVTVLFSAEAYIGYRLYKKYDNAYLLFFFLLNPIGIATTGYHSQFDILAIAVAFAAVLQLNKNNVLKAALLLACSLLVKHVMVFYAFFLLFDKDLSVKNRVILIFLPIGIFLASFIPFMKDFDAIKLNVFEYKLGFFGGLFPKVMYLLLPEQIIKSGLFMALPVFKDWMLVWLITMLFMGYLANKYWKQYLFEVYLVVLVLTSVSFSQQYLYIPVLAIAVFYRYYATWVYTFLAGFFLFFASFHNLGPLNLVKFFAINIDYEKLLYSYSIMQVWLLVLLYALFRDYRTGKLNKSIGT